MSLGSSAGFLAVCRDVAPPAQLLRINLRKPLANAPASSASNCDLLRAAWQYTEQTHPLDADTTLRRAQSPPMPCRSHHVPWPLMRERCGSHHRNCPLEATVLSYFLPHGEPGQEIRRLCPDPRRFRLLLGPTEATPMPTLRNCRGSRTPLLPG